MKLTRGLIRREGIDAKTAFAILCWIILSHFRIQAADFSTEKKLPPISSTAGTSPQGWVVSEILPDPALSPFSIEKLIDRLQEARVDSAEIATTPDPFWPIGGRPNLGSPRAVQYFVSSAAIELVRRGLVAVPALLKHLDDARPTKLVYVVAPLNPNQKGPPWFSDEYERRNDKAESISPLVGINTHLKLPIGGDGTFTFKVGDLCYVALGQIVGCALYAGRSTEYDFYSGDPTFRPAFEFINSPVIQPALANAARQDWSRLTSVEHEKVLRAHILPSTSRRPLDYSALVRLLYYYPVSGSKFAEQLMSRSLVSPNTGDLNKPFVEDGFSTTYWYQSQLVQHLQPFHSESLDKSRLQLFRSAALGAESDLKKLPGGTWDPSIPSLGSDLALSCARQLVHLGHDEELKKVFSARVEALRDSLQKNSPPANEPDTIKLVNGLQESECSEFLDELAGKKSSAKTEPSGNEDPSDARGRDLIRIGTVSAKRAERTAQISLHLQQPASDRILQGRLIILSAIDDQGVVIRQNYLPFLSPVAVVRSDEDILTGFPEAEFSAELSRPAPKAKAILKIEGKIELVVPDLDPSAVVTVDDLLTKLGTPLQLPALIRNEVSLTLIDKATYAQLNIQAPNGDVDPRKTSWSQLFNPGFGGPAYQPLEMTPGDVALKIIDPHQRLTRVEFKNGDGSILRYNRNGWFHSSGADGMRVDIFRLGAEIPPGTKIVIWLLSERTRIVAPFKLARLPIQ